MPRCEEVEAGCGPDNKEDCCASGHIQGGQYNRTKDQAYHATISDLELDRFEATVGRFRPFVEGYPTNKPSGGKGAHPRITGSGWDEAWNANLPPDQAALKASLQCDVNYRTWTDAPGPNEGLPINCVSWQP